MPTMRVRNRPSFVRKLAAISLSIPDGLIDWIQSGWSADRAARGVSCGNAPSVPATPVLRMSKRYYGGNALKATQNGGISRRSGDDLVGADDYSSGNQIANDAPIDISQAEVATGIAVCESLV